MIDVVITSTCRKTLAKTLESFGKHVTCSEGFRFIVTIDVIQKDNLKHVMRCLRQRDIHDIRVNHALGSRWENHAQALSYLFSRIESPYYFHLEDDWIFLRRIDLDALIRLMEKHPHIDHIRFSKEKIKPRTWLYYLSEEIREDLLVPNRELKIDAIPLVQTAVWSFNPSVNRTQCIKNFGKIPVAPQVPEAYICEKYSAMAERAGTYIFGKIGDGPLVQDIGRNRFRQWLRKTKYIMSGGKYAEYKF